VFMVARTDQEARNRQERPCRWYADRAHRP
jgi:hypothetical protein